MNSYIKIAKANLKEETKLPRKKRKKQTNTEQQFQTTQHSNMYSIRNSQPILFHIQTIPTPSRPFWAVIRLTMKFPSNCLYTFVRLNRVHLVRCFELEHTLSKVSARCALGMFHEMANNIFAR